jgi:flagella basal body P-ring formation protein FlgA
MRKTLYILLIIITFLSFVKAEGKSSFSGERLKEACLNYIYNIYGDNAEVQISKNIDDQIFDDDNITAQCDGNTKSLRGNCYVAIEFRKDEKLVSRIQIPVRIKIYGIVPVATELIKSADYIKDTQVTLEKIDITYIDLEKVENLEYIIGKKAKRNITAGTVITGGLLENEIMIHRGDDVRIYAQSGAVRISSTGKALQDAEVGQKVRIQRDGSRDILNGYVARDGSIFITSK